MNWLAQRSAEVQEIVNTVAAGKINSLDAASVEILKKQMPDVFDKEGFINTYALAARARRLTKAKLFGKPKKSRNEREQRYCNNGVFKTSRKLGHKARLIRYRRWAKRQPPFAEVFFPTVVLGPEDVGISPS